MRSAPAETPSAGAFAFEAQAAAKNHIPSAAHTNPPAQASIAFLARRVHAPQYLAE
jgi:hypothetical protein